MFEILCFGDSNTWGRCPDGERYPRSVRWTGVLQTTLGKDFTVIEEGLSGRTTVWEVPVEGDRMGKRHLLPCLQSHAPLDVVVFLLGTNDLKKRYSAPASDIALGMGVLVDIAKMSATGRAGAAPRILLLAPPPLGKLTKFADMLEGGVEKSKLLGELYREVARERGCSFLNTARVIHSSEVDGVHLDEGAHHDLGLAVAKKVRSMLPV